jgi:Ca2+-binding EF-hand superfamily protein
MFDEEQKGVLSRTEFTDFVKFIWLQLWLEQQRLQQMMELDSLEAEWRITNLLDMWHFNMVGLKGKWGTVCNSPDVPAWLKETLMDTSMTEMCEKQFSELDVDGNGVLSANELLPVIVELCQEHPLDITQEHCQTLLDIFDEDKSGTIERGEFLEFVRFIVVVSWLQEQAGNVAPPQTPSIRNESVYADSEAPEIEDRADPLLSLGQGPPSGLGQSPEKVFEGELKATQEALMATQNQLKAVQVQLQATTGQVAQALSGADMSSPNSTERLQWQKEKEKLLQELAAARQLADMQKKGMAETVGKLMTEKMELESQLTMAKVGK